jgi:hypothetical protein
MSRRTGSRRGAGRCVGRIESSGPLGAFRFAPVAGPGISHIALDALIVEHAGVNRGEAYEGAGNVLSVDKDLVLIETLHREFGNDIVRPLCFSGGSVEGPKTATNSGFAFREPDLQMIGERGWGTKCENEECPGGRQSSHARILGDSCTSPEHSIPGIVLACVPLVVMPLLSRAKRKVGRALGSAAMHADAKQTEFCTYLSAILLAGLLLNALFGLWWADQVAALIMVPIIAKEGIEGLQGKACDECRA